MRYPTRCRGVGGFVSDVIDVGIEVLPMKDMEQEMSSDVPYYERELLNVIRKGAECLLYRLCSLESDRRLEMATKFPRTLTKKEFSNLGKVSKLSGNSLPQDLANRSDKEKLAIVEQPCFHMPSGRQTCTDWREG